MLSNSLHQVHNLKLSYYVRVSKLQSDRDIRCHSTYIGVSHGTTSLRQETQIDRSVTYTADLPEGEFVRCFGDSHRSADSQLFYFSANDSQTSEDVDVGIFVDSLGVGLFRLSNPHKLRFIHHDCRYFHAWSNAVNRKKLQQLWAYFLLFVKFGRRVRLRENEVLWFCRRS